MAAWVCAECSTTYSVGASCCPHCHSTAHVDLGVPMPKITVHGGPSNAADPETAGAVEPPASTAPAPTSGGASSPGSSSSTSSESAETSCEPSETATLSPARKTASRSKKARTAPSSADSTDGDPTDDTSKA